MTTLFDLESELLVDEFESGLVQQELNDTNEAITVISDHVAFEMEAMEALMNEDATLPEFPEGSVVSELAMECALGTTGSVLIGMCALEDDSALSAPDDKQITSSWKDKLNDVFTKIKQMINALFTHIKDFVKKGWKYLTDRVVRMVSTLEKLRKLVSETDKVGNGNMPRPAGNTLSADPSDVIKEVELAHTVFSEFSNKIFNNTLEFSEKFIGIIKDHKSDIKDSEDIKVTDEIINKLEPIGHLLDFSDVKWLFVGKSNVQAGDFSIQHQSFVHTHAIMNKWLGCVFSTDLKFKGYFENLDEWQPKHSIPAFSELAQKPTLSKEMLVPAKNDLLTIIDKTIAMAKDFDRSLQSRFNKLIGLQNTFLASVERSYGRMYDTELDTISNVKGIDAAQVSKAIRLGIRLVGGLASTVQNTVNIHTQAVHMATSYATVSFKHYK